ncbi:hypothetical protein O6R08_09930 [Cutibacterium equinum]|uniref:Tat pathway signal sequence domain protein n=1 Tax=Cutibacterium equinum TaxID=3016342 RepID=A0ABY7QZH2_9ACTN|nr:hypothetical protein [Cutibacterium equinum]WCC79773.1 hypothetical protein O6R08_09930 [Cutibacterium equinum]
MTVVASTVLNNTPAGGVVTGDLTDAKVTNGLLSRNSRGMATVQWATILAPPQLNANATLRMVADVKDFEIPTFNVSVQPGLVTDPSVAALLDSSFNQDTGSEIELQRKTIELIGQVNEVLARSSKTIGDVRSNLDASSKTLGDKSIAELNRSTTSVAASVKYLDQQLKSLNQQLSTTLNSSRSMLLSKMQSTVAMMDAMLGDTTATPPTPSVDSKGCASTVATPHAATSVYGNLMQVSSQLNGYATATDQCRAQVVRQLLLTVGPATPTVEQCMDPRASGSVTCDLRMTQMTMDNSLLKINEEGQKLVASLDPTAVNDAITGFQELNSGVKDLESLAGHGGVMDGHYAEALYDLRTAKGRIEDGMTTLHRHAEGQKSDVDVALARLRAQRTEIADPATGMLAQMEAIADGVCELGPTASLTSSPSASASATPDPSASPDPTPAPTTPTPTPAAPSAPYTRDQLRAMSTGTTCTGRRTRASQRPAKWKATDDMRTRLTDQLAGIDAAISLLEKQSAAWQEVINWTVVNAPDDDPTTYHAFNLAIKWIDGGIAALKEGHTFTDSYSQELKAAVTSLAEGRDHMGPRLTALQAQQEGLSAAITEGFSRATANARADLATSITQTQRRVVEDTLVDASGVSNMFVASVEGLNSASVTISRNGTKSIREEDAQLAGSSAKLGEAIDEMVKTNLADIASSFSRSSRDLSGAGALLQADLNKVLLDLGDRKVKGRGLLGAMATSSAKVGSADYQLAMASGAATEYASVRGRDIDTLLMRQAQLKAATESQGELPAFRAKVPAGAGTQTVYNFTIGPTK